MDDYTEGESDGNLIDLINSRIDDEIVALRELNGESEDTHEGDCLGPEEVYRLAKRNVKAALSQAIARL